MATQDRPNVIIFPPAIVALTVALGCALQWLAPLGWLTKLDLLVRGSIGVALIVVGVGLAASGRRLLVRLGTNVSPLQPTTALATGGVYRWTRNPLYTGGTIVMFGIAFLFVCFF